MAKYRNLYQISLEDEDILDNVEATETVEVTEAIAAEEEQEEYVEQVQEIESDTVALEESEEVLEEVQEQVETNEEIIENQPEQITEEVVEVAQEAFMFSMARLGFPLSEIKRVKVSREDAISSPIQAFKLSTEGIKEWAAKIWEMIKNVFAKIGEMFKKLYGKAIVFMNRTKSNAESLLKKAQEIANDPKIEKELNDKIFNRLPIMLKATKGKVDSAKFLAVANNQFIPSFVRDINKINQAAISGTPVEAVRTLPGNVLKELPEIKNLADLKDTDVVTAAYKSGSITVVTTGEDDSLVVSSKDIAKDKLAPESVSGLGKGDIVNHLKAVIKHADGLKNYAKAQENAQKVLTDNLKKIVTEATDENKTAANKTARLARGVGSRLLLESIQQYIGVGNALLSICSLAIKAAGGSAGGDKKEEDKAEDKKEESK